MNPEAADIEIEPRELRHMIERRDEFLLIDVREPWEHQRARIQGSVSVPLREISGNVTRLAGPETVILYCHHGIRSLDAAAWLRSQGISGARSMAGGIDRWSIEVDPKVPRY
jgi:rhodanese-related sulfurtransferase